MVALVWTAAALAAFVLIWSVRHWLRRATAARRRDRAWAGFSTTCPAPPPGADGPAYPLAPAPGPAGEVVVRPDGLCLRLADHPGRPMWVPWSDVRRVEPAERSGVRLLLASGLDLYVGALGGRAIWEAQTVSRRLA